MRLTLALALALFSLTAIGSELKLMLAEHKLPAQPLNMNQLIGQPAEQLPAKKQGRLILTMPSDNTQAKLIQNNSKQLISDGRQLLPSIQIDYVINPQAEVIPKVRHLNVTDHPYWDYFVGVGKIWTSPENKTKTYMSLPFSLVEKNENCVHNGVLVVPVKQQKTATFYYQISSETCAYFKADFWGLGQVKYSQFDELDAKSIAQLYQQEKNQRLPLKPLSALTEHYSSVNLDNLALKQSIKSKDMSVLGVVKNQMHYRSDCKTRTGNYPFCSQLVLPSYSTAKTLFAGLAMFYLAKEFKDIFEQPVNQWINACQTPQWQGVNFGHLLNMSTGNYHSAKYGVDEGSNKKLAFFNATSHSKKLAFACQHYPRKNTPGTQFVYHTSDTYLLGAGLNAFIKSQWGEQADIFNDVIVKQIFKPLGLSAISRVSRRTQDNTAQPYSGYGLFFNADDLARLSIFVQQQAHSANSILANQPLRQALQLDPNNTGLGTDYGHINYQHSFWAQDMRHNLECKKDTWVPFMSGFGGITVALLGQDNSYYYVSDSHQYNWQPALPELQKLQLVCAN